MTLLWLYLRGALNFLLIFLAKNAIINRILRYKDTKILECISLGLPSPTTLWQILA